MYAWNHLPPSSGPYYTRKNDPVKDVRTLLEVLKDQYPEQRVNNMKAAYRSFTADIDLTKPSQVKMDQAADLLVSLNDLEIDMNKTSKDSNALWMWEADAEELAKGYVPVEQEALDLIVAARERWASAIKWIGQTRMKVEWFCNTD
jgi:hypothetical protein